MYLKECELRFNNPRQKYQLAKVKQRVKSKMACPKKDDSLFVALLWINQLNSELAENTS